MPSDDVEIIETNRFSEFVLPHDEPGMEILRSWLIWFYARNVDAVLELTGRGYAVYRNDLIQIEA